MSRNIQMSINNEKIYPYTIPEAVVIESESGISTLKDMLKDIQTIKDANGETYTLTEKIKLQNIETYANKYTHPTYHTASIIQQDEFNRFVTDIQINSWNSMLNNLATITGDNLDSSKLYTDNKIAEVIGGSQETLDTLRELANALGNDPNFATSISNQIGLKAPIVYVDEQLSIKYDKTGGLISGQVLTTIGNNYGVKFGTNYITSAEGNEIVLLGSSNGFRFSDSLDWNKDLWAGLKYFDATKTIYLGGPAGNQLLGDGNSTAFTVDMTLANAGVSSVKVDELDVESKVVGNLFTGSMSDTSKYRIVTDTVNKSLEIATGDILNAPIQIKQYSDVDFTTLVRTLTLLDASGNTTLPGKVTAATGAFTGVVTGPTASAGTNNTQFATTAFTTSLVNSKKINLDQLHSSTTITANTMTVNINIPTFDNANDILSVYANGLIVTDDDFVLNSNTSITSKDAINGFVATTVAPTTFTFIVTKASII